MIAPLLVVAALVGAWELYVRTGGVDDLVLSAPSQIAAALWNDRGLLASNLGVTAVEVGLGILAALVAGLALAIAIHLLPPLRSGLYPLMIGTQAVPVPVVAPLLVYWLGFGIAPKLVIVAAICFFPITVSTYDGLSRVDPEQRKLMRTLGASEWQSFRFVSFPTALPAALSGARIAVAVAVIAAVFAESAGSTSGLGNLLVKSSPALETARGYAAVTVLAAFAVALFWALGFAERHLLTHRLKEPSK